MKKTLYLCATIIVSLSLIGCSSTSDKTNSLKSSTSKEEQKDKENSIQLKENDIQEIKLTRTNNNKLTKTETYNEDMIKAITTAIQNGTPKKITLDQKTKDSIHSNMTVTFKDSSTETFFVWIDDKSQITIAESTDQNYVQGLMINTENSKIAPNFFKK
ncbi:hypothetical protein CN326_18620 [Bacillus sp. AFS018417]|uniref:hypothetical protein n=1 Tax=Bacillus sp. AFS018417 TaxID=2033491 RepID=UPI000BF5E57B|nr:hypothetical protein [Bacillus sp. AFS018417]PEZ03340.1 hypothetical protein CN326_18620 [Bacillus sp. AFS018417]